MIAERIEYTVEVTITKTVKVQLPADLAKPESIEEWRRGLWDIDGVQDIAKYAAEHAASGRAGFNLDGIGYLVGPHDSKKDSDTATVYEILDEDCECEIVGKETP